jgi:hypothetical protein
MRSPLLLAACDLAAIVVFVTIGLFVHKGGVSATGYAETALPLAAAWFAAGAFFGAFTTRRLVPVLATWACGVPVGVVIRALILDHHSIGSESAFLAVCLVTIGALVASFRGSLALFSLAAERRTRTRSRPSRSDAGLDRPAAAPARPDLG